MAVKKSIYKLRDSDRSGFTYKEIDLMRDKGSLVYGDEFDMPPPSNKSLGGEGVVMNPEARINSDSYTALNSRLTQVITAVGGITFVDTYDSQNKFDLNNQWIYVSGDSATTDISANPQISAGYNNAVFTVQCVSNAIILDNSNGLVMNKPFRMTSGSIITFFYNGTNNLWYETARSNINGG